jgi:ATP-binding cassette, subfamily B, bacterial
LTVRVRAWTLELLSNARPIFRLSYEPRMNERSRNARDSLRRLLKYAAGHRRRVLLATLCSMLNKLFDIAPEILIGVAVDTVVQKQASALAKLGVTDVKQQLLVLSALTLLIWMCESLFEFCYGVLWRNLAQTVQHELRRDSYGHVQKLELAYF